MKRREFIQLAGGVVSWPTAARAQQAGRKQRIGALFAAPAGDALTTRALTTVVRELDRLGWKEEVNVALYNRFVVGVADLPAVASELVALQPDVILAVTTPAVKAAINATQQIPIVFAAVADPLGTGIVSNLAHPGGNVTGFSNAVAPLAGKWLELVRELDSRLGRVGLMFNPESAAGRGAASLRELSTAAAQVKVEAIALEVRAASEIENAVASLGQGARGALLVTQDVFNASNRAAIIATAAEHRVPAVYPFRFYAAEGGLMSYGVDVFEGIRQAASYLDRILKGAKPGELPVQQPLKFELVINLKTAKALGIAVPPSLLARADEVIE